MSSSQAQFSRAGANLSVFQSLDWLGRCPTASRHDGWALAQATSMFLLLGAGLLISLLWLTQVFVRRGMDDGSSPEEID